MNLLRGEISFRKLCGAPHFTINLIPAVSWPTQSTTHTVSSESTHLITRVHTIECKWEFVLNKYAVKLIMANIWAQIGCLSIWFLFVAETHLGGGSCWLRSDILVMFLALFAAKAMEPKHLGVHRIILDLYKFNKDHIDWWILLTFLILISISVAVQTTPNMPLTGVCHN